jgi:D-alanyl-lipoteichoic acid acyltransferase DltB (MBOAT superfamily)
VSGFWHGANWTFIIWGALNAIYFLPLLLFKKNRINTNTVASGRYLPTVKEFFQMGITFSLTVFAWIFFRAESIGDALNYLSIIFSKSIISTPYFNEMRHALVTVILIIVFLFVEWLGRDDQYAIERLGLKWQSMLRYAMYSLIILAIFLFMGNQQQFIYFQF